MAGHKFDNESGIVSTTGQAMRNFIFKSEANPDLRAFGGDLAGSRLPSRFRPWPATGAIASDHEPPHNMSCRAIEAAINDCGYQLWRFKKLQPAPEATMIGGRTAHPVPQKECLR